MKFSDMSLTAKVVTVTGFGVVYMLAGAFSPALSQDPDPDGSGDSVSSDQVTYYVELKPLDAGVLEVKHTNKCKNKKHPGCLLFEEGKVGLIKFFLAGSRNKDKKCPEAQKVIIRIELTAKGKAPDPKDVNPVAAKGDFTGKLPHWVKDDAFSVVDLSTGIVYQATSVDDARSQAWLVNMNSHDATEGVKSFWYKVTATACEENKDGTRDAWVTDPRGDNEGLK